MQKDLKIFIPQWDKYSKKLLKFNQVRINPLHNGKVIEIEIIYEKRKNKISDLMHKVSMHTVRYMLSKKIGTIVVGYNRGWKDSIRIGGRNNQTFVQIPYISPQLEN